MATSSPKAEQRRWPRRTVFFLLSLIPIVLLVALFTWALARSGGNPGGLGINNKLGEVRIQPGPAPDFELALFNGQALRLSDLRGSDAIRVVMVDFWASWCPPCREEAPVLQQVYQEYQGRGVEFVGVAIWDGENEARRFLQRNSITYPNGLDPKGSIAIDYGVRGIPEKFFIGPDGTLVKKFIGPMTVERLRSILEELLQAQ
jgi:cytochrome c biogenesis protein CcmG/thiol:disulfide interchange protein DsbE